MITVQATPSAPSSASPPPPPPGGRPQGRSLTPIQRLVVAAAALPLLGIAAIAAAGALGLIRTGVMVDLSLALGEDPGMVVFAAMLCCSPVQWYLKQTQVSVRKWLGILFSGYAAANFVMFVVDRGVAASVSAPFLVAGVVAAAATVPLLLTSGRWAQRAMGIRNWRMLHKLTYLIAVALVAHVALIGEIGLTGALVAIALATRLPGCAEVIRRAGERRRNANG